MMWKMYMTMMEKFEGGEFVHEAKQEDAWEIELNFGSLSNRARHRA